MTQAVVAVLEEKKGNDIQRLECHGENDPGRSVCARKRHLECAYQKQLAESVEEKMKDAFGIHPDRIEGMDSRSWITLDYGDIVVHIMMPEDRACITSLRVFGAAAENDAPFKSAAIDELKGADSSCRAFLISK